ncbi:hypothetical protein VNO77_27227 [Canavalia gladiata]|uniref:Uncharacterized protein n=1 Tax=Canavalia gladiata TaxID=3824 RepID=A0AAN9Q6A3_CANGL
MGVELLDWDEQPRKLDDVPDPRPSTWFVLYGLIGASWLPVAIGYKQQGLHVEICMEEVVCLCEAFQVVQNCDEPNLNLEYHHENQAWPKNHYFKCRNPKSQKLSCKRIVQDFENRNIVTSFLVSLVKITQVLLVRFCVFQKSRAQNHHGTKDREVANREQEGDSVLSNFKK